MHDLLTHRFGRFEDNARHEEPLFLLKNAAGAQGSERVNTFETLLFMKLRLSGRFCSWFVQVTAVG